MHLCILVESVRFYRSCCKFDLLLGTGSFPQDGNSLFKKNIFLVAFDWSPFTWKNGYHLLYHHLNQNLYTVYGSGFYTCSVVCVIYIVPGLAFRLYLRLSGKQACFPLTVFDEYSWNYTVD